MELGPYLMHAWFIIVFSAFVTLFVFPLVFVMNFLYSVLRRKYEEVPQILLMALVTFLGCLIAVFLLEVYLGYALPQIVQALSS